MRKFFGTLFAKDGGGSLDIIIFFIILHLCGCSSPGHNRRFYLFGENRKLK